MKQNDMQRDKNIRQQALELIENWINELEAKQKVVDEHNKFDYDESDE